MFFVPFSWYIIWRLLRGGGRYALRHVIVRTIVGFIVGEFAIGGAIWALRGEHTAFGQALIPAAWFAAFVALLSTLEPLFAVVAVSIRSGAVATRLLKQTSIGFRLWCAFAAAVVVTFEASHFPALAHVLAVLRATSGWWGVGRFVVGTTLAFVPVVWLAIWGLEALDGFRPERRPVGTPWTPPEPPRTVRAEYIPPPPRPPTPRPVAKPRIVSVTVDGRPQPPHSPS